MAEKISRERRDDLSRRSSFRRSLAEAGLPLEYLDTLEEKRKQLDDSIHKYIASKEREYKQFEKDVRQQYRVAQNYGNGEVIGAAKRRTSSESTFEPGDSPMLKGRHIPTGCAVDALLATSSRRDSDSQTVANDDEILPLRGKANLTDRQAIVERDKEFAGLFTPPYLSALEHQNGRKLERTTSAPPIVVCSEQDNSKDALNARDRADSDTALQAKPKRPVHLQLVQRTSSSGSSVDSKLVSAMKSPSEVSRPKRKRVSLAVGDAIVAPSDTVPLTLTNNHTPSHSRMRSPAPPKDRTAIPEDKETEALAESVPFDKPTALNAGHVGGSASLANGIRAMREQDPAAASTMPANTNPPRLMQAGGDDVGDMWHMEESDEAEPSAERAEEDLDIIDEEGSEIAGRVGSPNKTPQTLPPDAREAEPPDGANRRDDSTAASQEDPAVHIEFRPGSVAASQQPTNPGFRRPSVSGDPVFSGRSFEAAKTDAEENGVYGSSYNRPTSKGSFTGGSLGESFMARHAEEMMRVRMARREGEVRS